MTSRLVSCQRRWPRLRRRAGGARDMLGGGRRRSRCEFLPSRAARHSTRSSLA